MGTVGFRICITVIGHELLNSLFSWNKAHHELHDIMYMKHLLPTWSSACMCLCLIDVVPDHHIRRCSLEIRYSSCYFCRFWCGSISYKIDVHIIWILAACKSSAM